MKLELALLAMLQFSGYPGAPAAPPSRMAGPARGASEARAFLAGVYAGYARRGGQGAPLRQPNRLFEPMLAAAIARDGGNGLDFDPFCAGQDWDPFTAAISPISVSGDHATATVSFRNGRPVTIRFDLLRTPAGWRIYDMRGTDLPGLRAKMLSHHRRPKRRTGDDAVD